MTFVGDMLIGIFLAAATTALVSKRHRPRARIVAAVSLLLFAVYLTRGPVTKTTSQATYTETTTSVTK